MATRKGQYRVAIAAFRHADGRDRLRDAAAFRSLEITLRQRSHAGERQGVTRKGSQGDAATTARNSVCA